MASVFGITPTVAAFFVAFRFANVFRRVLAEGPFQTIFIPFFEESRLKNEKEAHLFYKNLMGVFLLLLIFLIILVEISLSLLLRYNLLSSGSLEIVFFTRWLFPAILFICLFGLNQAFLHCYDTFFIPSFAPIICNMCWIAGVFFARGMPLFNGMLLLSKFILFGYVGQWLCTAFFVHRKLGCKLSFSFHPQLKNLLFSFILGTIGVCAMQVNVLADSLFARMADLQGPAYLWYSVRMQQLVLALFGISIVTAITPRLSRAIKSLDKPLVKALLLSTLQKSLALMLPATFLAFYTGPSAVNLLYGRGAMLASDLICTSYCLWAYSLALLPATLTLLLTSYFFASKLVKIPTMVSLFSVLLNLMLNALFIFFFKLGPVSVAFSTSLCAWFSFFALFKTFKRKEASFLFPSYKKLLGISVTSLLFSICIEPYFFQNGLFAVLSHTAQFPRSSFYQVIEFIVKGAIFCSCFCVLGFVAKCKELFSLAELFGLKSFIKEKSL